MKIFFCKKSLINSAFVSKVLRVFLCVLLVTVISSQLFSFGSSKLTQVVSRSAENFFYGISLKLSGGNGKNIQILVNGKEYAYFDNDTADIPISGGCVIEVYNPSDKNVRLSISHVSEGISVINYKSEVICRKGITYICKAFSE